ncbi:hypothetical protein BRIN106911_24165 [Brevibacillus invocatus]
MRKVISNSSPIIALSIIGHLSLMNELFDEVYLPAEVYREIVESESLREHGKRELQEAVEHGRFQIYRVQNEELVSKLYGRASRSTSKSNCTTSTTWRSGPCTIGQRCTRDNWPKANHTVTSKRRSRSALWTFRTFPQRATSVFFVSGKTQRNSS